MQRPPQSQTARAATTLGFAALVAIAGLNYQFLFDQYALATFHPAPEVAAIESRMGLTSPAKAAFYRSAPQVDDKNSFNDHCNTRPHELELGCYNRGRIFVMRIDNPSLAPEMDVVTAHELLHAVWVRMSGTERQAIGTELNTVYAAVGDADLRQRMANYAKSEPGEETNELHSILGTEYARLSPVLEKHYAKYFQSRSSVVASHTAYQTVFNDRRLELENELGSIRQEKDRLSVLNNRMEALKAGGSIYEYNALVPGQNKMVDEINQRIADYRLAVGEYNALSLSLDSQEIPETDIPTAAR